MLDMTYIYIDESGDLGFNSRGSCYFIITGIRINEENVHTLFKRIPKKVRILLRKKHRKKTELKFSNSSDLIRTRFLKQVASLPIEVFSLVIEKKYTSDDLRKNIPILYNYLIKILLEKLLSDINQNDPLEICLDRSMSKVQRENFENYVKTEFLSLFQHLPKLEIKHDSSEHNECLQVTDFICGAFGYKYNTLNLSSESDKYTLIIQSKIKIEKVDLFKNKATHAYLSRAQS